MIQAFSAITGWTLFAGLTLALGAITAHWILVPRAIGRDGSEAALLSDRDAAMLGLAGGGLLLVALGLYFFRQLEEFRDPFVPWTEDVSLLLGLGWGTSWKLAVAGATAVLVGSMASLKGWPLGWLLVTPATLILASFPAFTGHAAGVESLRWLALMADTVHVWAAGAWIGGIGAILFLDRGARLRSPGGYGALTTLVPAFTGLAIIAVATLMLTGLYASWTHLDRVSMLWSSWYGQLLSAKLALVGIVLALGAWNNRSAPRRLTSKVGTRALRRAVAVEFLVAQLVLLVTALLVRTSPLGH